MYLHLWPAGVVMVTVVSPPALPYNVAVLRGLFDASPPPPPPPTIHAQNFAAVLLSLASAPSATPDNIQFRLSIAFQFE